MQVLAEKREQDWSKRITSEQERAVIDAGNVHYRELNQKIREMIKEGAREIELRNVNGQRYIGTGITNPDVKIYIHGTPGNDLAAFMDGPRIEVFGNAQDGVSNTMNSGKVVINGHAGDVLGYGMRGGKMHIRKNVGYRVGIHMKAFGSMMPVIIAGGTGGDFFGEYMAGGILVLLGLEKKPEEKIVGDWCGTGIHGGVIYIRGTVESHQLGKEVGVVEKIPAKEMDELAELLKDYCGDFNLNLEEVIKEPFIKLYPYTTRPYGKLYAY
jgi:glutamate synthase domain-containing protein 3